METFCLVAWSHALHSQKDENCLPTSFGSKLKSCCETRRNINSFKSSIKNSSSNTFILETNMWATPEQGRNEGKWKLDKRERQNSRMRDGQWVIYYKGVLMVLILVLGYIKKTGKWNMVNVAITELLNWVELQTPQLQTYCNCCLVLVEKGASVRFFSSHQVIPGLLEAVWPRPMHKHTALPQSSKTANASGAQEKPTVTVLRKSASLIWRKQEEENEDAGTVNWPTSISLNFRTGESCPSVLIHFSMCFFTNSSHLANQ